MLLFVNKSIITVYANFWLLFIYFDKENNNNYKAFKMLERDREDVCLLCSESMKCCGFLWVFSTVAWLSPHVLAEQVHVQSSRERSVSWLRTVSACVTVRVLDVSSFLRCISPSSLLCASLPPRRQAPRGERARPQHPPAEQHLAQELRVHAGAGRSGRRSGGQRASSHPGGDAGVDPAQGQREEAGGRLARRHQG